MDRHKALTVQEVRDELNRLRVSREIQDKIGQMDDYSRELVLGVLGILEHNADELWFEYNNKSIDLGIEIKKKEAELVKLSQAVAAIKGEVE